jgi:hypothetical protein
MNHRKLLVTGLFVVLICYACGGGGVSGGIGYVPKITAVSMININDPSKPIRGLPFTAGDKASFEIDVEDNDSNMNTLWVTIYKEADLETPFEGPTSFLLPKQTSNPMFYDQMGTMTINEPPGTYSASLQIGDIKGNISDSFNVGNFVVK